MSLMKRLRVAPLAAQLVKEYGALPTELQRKIEEVHRELRIREARAERRSVIWEVVRPVVWMFSLMLAFGAGVGVESLMSLA